MVVEPRVKDYICTTAHPVGCAENIKNQIKYVKAQPKVDGPKKVLVIGASTGYGLASRIAVAFGYGADTLGVMFEKESNGRRTATAGFYNTRAFEEEAKKDGLYAKSINGDAFSLEIKQQVIDTIKADMGKVDMVIYSLWGFFLGLATIMIKPFISIRQTLRDMLITFLVSMLCGLLAEYMDIPTPVKYGISGVCGLFAVRIYMIADSVLKTAQNDPFNFIKNIKGRK